MKLELYFKNKNMRVIENVYEYNINYERDLFEVSYSTPFKTHYLSWDLSEIQIGYIDEEWTVGDGEPYDREELEEKIERVICETFELPCCKNYFKQCNGLCGTSCEKKGNV